MTIGKRRGMTSGLLHGQLDARFEPLRDVLEDSLGSVADCGLSLVMDVDFWGGWGGSLIIMDLDRRTTISYMMNKMQPGLVGSDIAAGYLKVIYELLG
jgi:hypothetical protein